MSIIQTLTKVLKNNDHVYSYLSSAYHKTPFYKNYLKQKKKIGIKSIKMVQMHLNNKFVVRNGPFKNMLYLKDPSLGAILPKIIGSYEEPIHQWISESIDRKYSKIINLGSAEGYYAVGLANKIKDCKVVASDTSKQARQLCKKLSKKNKCNNVEVVGKLSHRQLGAKIPNKNTLILCDIEGDELSVLDPEKIPNLQKTDIICEVHDHLVNKNVTDRILERFYNTHIISMVTDNKRNPDNYKSLKKIPKRLHDFSLDERRSGVAKWVKLEAR